ncbi:hypothetical protein KC350_g9073 [Hortaea werneckii]|nr:hypothetical protein KC350_g9073 [Hortaea werneckii]KAI7443385.1 hypothetical protein KC368_g8991 [Hortaea werneckii]
MEQMNGGYQHQPIGGLQHHGSFSDSPPEQQQQQQGAQGNKDFAAHQRTYQGEFYRCAAGEVGIKNPNADGHKHVYHVASVRSVAT